MPMTRAAPLSSSARAWPPRPMVQSTKTPPRDGARCSSTSPTMTGSCTIHSPPSVHRMRARFSNSVLGQPLPVVVAPPFAPELLHEVLFVPDLEILDASEDANIADDRRPLA